MRKLFLTDRSITVLIGLPGAGKTTFANTLRSASEIPTVIISRDQLREMLFGDNFFSGGEKGVTAIMKRIALDAVFVLKTSVIIDDITLDKSTQDEWRDLCDRYGIRIVLVDVATDVNTCIERDSRRLRPVGASVIREFAAEYGRG